MATSGDDIVHQYRAMVEERVREQIARHQQVDPNADPRRAVEIQIRQEREHLERLIKQKDTTPAQAEALASLIEWLPALERKLKGL